MLVQLYFCLHSSTIIMIYFFLCISPSICIQLYPALIQQRLIHPSLLVHRLHYLRAECRQISLRPGGVQAQRPNVMLTP
ncbi:hypothetical protein DNTS_021528 [Danionella cerebrum]|uniref:Uncharacterized protein n=1 Tax=Danionella cerebrum TaxID=2873325 RepID=A0A553QI89_9TELE|nr:hypothetical protein DNTS_021528 [Danionella translucida]